jgi:hypothetical protein
MHIVFKQGNVEISKIVWTHIMFEHTTNLLELLNLNVGII